METLPDRTSNAGPDSRSATEEMDWRDYIWYAKDQATDAYNMEQTNESMVGSKRNAERVRLIELAIEALESAKELLCR